MSNLGNTLLPKRVTKNFGEIKIDIQNRISEIVPIIEEKYKVKLPPIKIDLFGIKRGGCAGKARYKDNCILINLKLLIENYEHYLKTVLTHEIVHLGIFEVYFRQQFKKVKGHGAEFKEMMQACGEEGLRCHSYNTDSVKKFVQYSCNCPGRIHKIGPTVSNRIAMGQKKELHFL